ncbi:hypothetical protein [Phytohabitans aurantiacus]|uniref:Uncharacterized protein n=1 Tax=Phytohabitans aurantiacus TaxID=3016789 RepID=A0ABQ5RAW1_9ACTN|nr:hypothetical protein [Phytohabitans aurantiacus]GLI03795.1 hypothetical protein Pa4123_90750 [Phytohabitans aurantiacus]
MKPVIAAAQTGADSAAAVRPFAYGEIVDKAGQRIVSRLAGRPVLVELCSGITDGDLWTTINAAEQVDLPGAPDGMLSLKITADVEKLKFVSAVALHMTMLGWQLYDKRSRAPY